MYLYGLYLYIVNLSKIQGFANDVSKNEAIEITLDKSPAFDWSSYYQSQTLNALSQYTSFLNKTSSITNNN